MTFGSPIVSPMFTSFLLGVFAGQTFLTKKGKRFDSSFIKG